MPNIFDTIPADDGAAVASLPQKMRNVFDSIPATSNVFDGVPVLDNVSDSAMGNAGGQIKGATGGLSDSQLQHALSFFGLTHNRPAEPFVESIHDENARLIALDQPFAAVGPGGKIFQETPRNNPEANGAEFAKLWQVPGDLASAVAADSVAHGTTPITQALYGKDSTPPWFPINTAVALENAFRDTASKPNPQPLPIDVDYAQLSQQHPVLATTAKISRGVTSSAPLLAVGGAPAWVGRLMALGFTAQMIADAGPAAQRLGTELGKNPEDRDNNVISSAVSSLVQDFGFAPFAGLHGTRDLVERYTDKPMAAVRPLSDQLQNTAIVRPDTPTDDIQKAGPASGVNDALPSPTPVPDKIDNMAKAVKDLQDTLRARLPAPADREDQVIRNVFPVEEKPIAGSRGAIILGGAYKDLKAGTGENHHTPAASVSTLPKSKGPAVWMQKADHAGTGSHGTKGLDGAAYRARQAALIEQGKFDEALQMDIEDIKSKFGTKYDEGIKQMLEYYKTIPSWKLKLK